ncbi:AcrR family transcriptional regulator [Bombiscardovia apis]|uniref:AcrR family transcriptional regulator n=1 Tax=Bombiscardovia apis TaxID=2932182 RepID=A0ABM8BC91_9BIFI|nr:TetR/AcrR family transcriptional regulator [Bombiscardovia apis]BDR54523.1 AcrR family transcriptional regulator [Bombiscardovia apis]
MAQPESTSRKAAIESNNQASRRGNNRRDQIVHAAREICLEKGFTHITVSDITCRVGITRSLFYHYFRNKEDVAEAVLDDAINAIIARLDAWNETRVRGQVDQALDDMVSMMRVIIADEGPFSKKMVQSGNSGLYIQFVDQVSQRVSDYICQTTVKDFEHVHGSLPIKHVKETLMMMISGSIALLREQPHISDEDVKEIFIQTLQLEDYL